MRNLCPIANPNSSVNEKFSRLPDLSPTRFLWRNPADWRDRRVRTDQRVVYRFSHGRSALRLGLEILGLGPGDRVLIPDFICDVAVDPLRDLGIEPVFYEISRELKPDWEALHRASDSSVKALFMIHYFGQPQDVEKFRTFSREHEQLLIEDNCHGWGALAPNGQPLCSFGDIGISSPRKVLPILNGGTLEVSVEKNPHLDSQPNNAPFGAIRNLIKSTARELLSPFPPLLNRIRSPQPYHIQDAFKDEEIPRWSMDRKSLEILESTDFGKVAGTRREIYSIWNDWLNPSNLEPVFKESAAGASPLLFPAWAPSEKIRNQWFDWGFANRIDVHSWPTLPAELVTESGNASELWKHLVCFPIHQEMNPDRLKRKLAPLASNPLP